MTIDGMMRKSIRRISSCDKPAPAPCCLWFEITGVFPLAAVQPLERVGLPQPPPWRRDPDDELEKREPGEMRLHGFVSKPEIQKLNRNSIYIFTNGRLIRDRLIQHALTEAYRNILPPSVFPVVLLFIEMPAAERA